MGLTERIKAQSTATVEHAGILWRIRRVSSLDVAMAGHAMLVRLPDDVAGDLVVGDTASMAAKAQSLATVEYERYALALVIPAVEAASEDDGATWEVLTLTEDGDTGEGRIAVRDLPPGTVQALYDAVWSLSTGGTEAAESLRSFRAAAGGAARGR